MLAHQKIQMESIFTDKNWYPCWISFIRLGYVSIFTIKFAWNPLLKLGIQPLRSCSCYSSSWIRVWLRMRKLFQFVTVLQKRNFVPILGLDLVIILLLEPKTAIGIILMILRYLWPTLKQSNTAKHTFCFIFNENSDFHPWLEEKKSKTKLRRWRKEIMMIMITTTTT